jgi:uncharacterized membrane protein YgcG
VNKPGCLSQESENPMTEAAYERIEMAETSIISCFLVLCFLIVVSRHMQFKRPYAKPRFGKKSSGSGSGSSSQSRSSNSAGGGSAVAPQS